MEYPLSNNLRSGDKHRIAELRKALRLISDILELMDEIEDPVALKEAVGISFDRVSNDTVLYARMISLRFSLEEKIQNRINALMEIGNAATDNHTDI